jgi:arabinofuranosyltransferase
MQNNLQPAKGGILKMDSKDAKFVLIVIAILALYLVGILIINHALGHILPFEDTIMLMRYAQNFANGHGIVWNVGQEPVDGCTEIPVVIVAAQLIKLGLSAETSLFILELMSHFFTALIIYMAIKKLHGLNNLPAVLTGLLFTIGPGLFYITSYWVTPIFALATSLTWYFAIRILFSDLKKSSIYFSLCGLIAGLVRPEGVFLSIFFLLAIIYIKGFRKSVPIILNFIGVFAILGGIFFIWRWHYFGYPLPNPYYRKGGGALYIEGLKNAIKNTSIFFIPVFPALIYGLRSKLNYRLIAFSLIPVMGFTMIWILLTPEQNFIGRFQYPLFPMLLMSWPFLAGFRNTSLSLSRIFSNKIYKALLIGISILVIIIFIFYFKTIRTKSICTRDGRHDIALVLAKYQKKGYTMAVSEAGHLPYYSGWNAVDIWGLNDKWVAHHGNVTEEYLDRFKPEIINFYADILVDTTFNMANLKAKDIHSQKWYMMTYAASSYAIHHNYILAAIYGYKRESVQYYYVRRDFPESAEICAFIRGMDYYTALSSEKCRNFAFPLDSLSTRY